MASSILERIGGGDAIAEPGRLDRRLDIPQIDSGDLRIPPPGHDQRKRDGAIEQVGSTRLARALRRPGDVEHVIEDLKGKADLLAETGKLSRGT